MGSSGAAKRAVWYASCSVGYSIGLAVSVRSIAAARAAGGNTGAVIAATTVLGSSRILVSSEAFIARRFSTRESVRGFVSSVIDAHVATVVVRWPPMLRLAALSAPMAQK